MTLIHITTFTADSRSATLVELLKLQGLEKFEPQKSESGKPFLQDCVGRQAGLAISHVRGCVPPFSIMAISKVGAVGIDAEVWPPGGTNEPFLASIAAPEDGDVIVRARTAGRDPATLLWVLKESALKASDDVMTDPRHLTVGVSINGHNQTLPSGAASAPLLRCKLRVFEMHINATERGILVSVAIAGFHGAKNRQNLDVICDNPNIRLKVCDWL